jgi:hypothetical protein
VNPGKRAILPSVLLAAVVVANYAYDPIASFYPNPQAAARAWYYVLHALESLTLYFVILSLVRGQAKVVRYAVSGVCAWGALESFQAATCRLSFPMGSPAPAVSQFTGLCDLVTGLPVYMATVAALFVLALLGDL